MLCVTLSLILLFSEEIIDVNVVPLPITLSDTLSKTPIFLKLLPADKRIGLDIEPYDDEIIKQDFMDWEPENDSKSE